MEQTPSGPSDPAMAPIEFEVDCGGAAPIRFRLDRDGLEHTGLRAKYAVADDRARDGHARYWHAACAIAEALMERNDHQPVWITAGADTFAIPAGSIRWVRLHDPAGAGRRTEVAFRAPDFEDGAPAR